MSQVGDDYECACGRGDKPCPGPDGKPLCAVEVDDDKCPECDDAGFVDGEPCIECNKLHGLGL